MGQVVKTACGICYMYCGLNVEVQEGKVVKIRGMKEHPGSRGNICPKAAAFVEHLYSEDRLKCPLKRMNGDWKRISWDEALDTIADKLKETKESYGARSFAYLIGDAICIGGATNMDVPFRFCDVYGTPNRFTPGSYCAETQGLAQRFTNGRLYPLVSVSEDSKCIVLWGHNPNNSQPSAVKRIESVRKGGGKIIVIDPRSIYFAKRSDVHAKVRPGSDCALALGILNVIVSENLYDREFVQKWTIGFDKLSRHLQDYPPQKVEEMTWVPAETIKEIARVYATNKPASIIRGVNSLDQHPSGFQTQRAIEILQAITGNMDIPDGIVASPFPNLRSIRLPEMVKEKPLGADKYPLFCVDGFLLMEGQGSLLADTILTGQPYPIKVMIIAGGNPALVMPNSNKFRKALGKLDFLVVMDMFMSETAKYADMVLPAASFLERTDLMGANPIIDGIPYIMLRKKAIDEYFESWSDIRFWLELAKSMGYDEYFPWKDEEELFDDILEPMGLTVEYLKEEKPEGILFDSLKYKEYEEKGFPTPSGKVELYSERLEKLGYDPLPVHSEPLESPMGSPELTREYPLILTTGARMLEFYHTQFRNIPSLSKRAPEPTVEVHPDTAGRYGVKDGDMVIVETKRGRIKIKAKVTEDIVPQVVNIPHGWAQANVNILTDDRPCDPVTGYPGPKSLLCRMEKIRA